MALQAPVADPREKDASWPGTHLMGAWGGWVLYRDVGVPIASATAMGHMSGVRSACGLRSHAVLAVWRYKRLRLP